MGKPSRHAKQSADSHHQIESIEVSSGFLGGVQLEFVDGLNCIIGGRGTGKTTAIEFVRYALGLTSETNGVPESKPTAKLLQKNLGSGEIRLRLQTQHGAEYVVERTYGDGPRVRNDKDEPVAVSLDRDLVFRADAFSQSEIERVATDPEMQLRLLDRFIEGEIRKLTTEERELLRELAFNADKLLHLEEGLDNSQELADERSGVEEQLRTLKPAADATSDKMETAHRAKAKRDSESQALDVVQTAVDALLRQLDDVAGEFERETRDLVDSNLHHESNADVFAPVIAAVQATQSALNESISLVQPVAESAVDAAATAAEEVATRHAQQEHEFHRLVEESQIERGRVRKRTELERHLEKLTAELKRLHVLRADKATLDNERSDLLARISSLRDRRFASRKKVATRLTKELSPGIRVSISQAGENSAYRSQLGREATGSRVQATVLDRIVAVLSPEELGSLVRLDRGAELAERAGVPSSQAQRLVAKLKGTRFAYDLDTLEVGDSVTIELRDGSRYKSSTDLSAGQRCTAILPVLMLQSERPLLIDQPEDNLDNAYIYDTIVKSVREVKGQRQLIFITHNPNIPVLGEADRVFVMDSNGERASVRAAGDVDQVKDHIETLLEGGREAFTKRKERYGH